MRKKDKHSYHTILPWDETNPNWWKYQIEFRGEYTWDWLVTIWADWRDESYQAGFEAGKLEGIAGEDT